MLPFIWRTVTIGVVFYSDVSICAVFNRSRASGFSDNYRFLRELHPNALQQSRMRAETPRLLCMISTKSLLPQLANASNFRPRVFQPRLMSFWTATHALQIALKFRIAGKDQVVVFRPVLFDATQKTACLARHAARIRLRGSPGD